MRNFSILFAVIVMTLAMSGCTTLLNEQAAAAAKDAENIARGCPAAAEKAAECREAAEAMETLQNNYLEFQSVGEDIAGVRRELADLRSQLDALDAQLANENYRTDADTARMQQEASDYDADAATLAAYERRESVDLGDAHAKCAHTDDFFGCWDLIGSPDTITVCSYPADCRHKAAQTRLALQNTPHINELNTQRDQIESEIRRAQTRLQILHDEYKRLNTEIIGYENENNSEREMANQAPAIVQQRMTELNETAQQARAEAQRIAAEQCGEGAALQDAPPKPSLPSGDYPQDILNSQGMGLPGGPAPLACPISCAGITQAWCSSNCSVFIGPQCGLCPFCAAQGCP